MIPSMAMRTCLKVGETGGRPLPWWSRYNAWSVSRGFKWGCPGDEVQFIRSNTMELVGKQNKIISIRPYDKEQTEGARSS